MHKIIQLITRGKHLFDTDSLFRNSVYLIASTAIMSVLGFLFWLSVAHLYTAEQIGSASALIAATTLLGNASLLGMEYSLIRFLPKSKNQSRDINAAIGFVAVAAIIAAIGYILVSPALNIHISHLDDPLLRVGFVVLMVVVALNSLTDAVFIANRRAELHTLTYSVLATVKLLLPLALVPFGSLGIFAGYAVAMLSSLTLTFFLMRRHVGYKPKSSANWGLLSKVRTYAANNYIGHLLASISPQLMPLIILNGLGAEKVAYFAMAITIANFLYVIPVAIAQSLLAESAGSPEAKRAHIRGAVKILSLVLVPAVTVAVLAAPILLHIFGQQYSDNSTTLFQILAFATFFIAVSEVGNAILNIEHRSSGVVVSQLSCVAVTLVATILLLPHGLVGVGFALLLGNIASNISHLIFFAFGIGKKKEPLEESEALAHERGEETRIL